MRTRHRDASLSELVNRARSAHDPEHEDAFGEIVRRFQAHAQASAYRLVRDFQLAQDVAQEAFLDAYLGLGQLRDPAAFPGWFRRIVFKHADRIRRRPGAGALDLEVAQGVSSPEAGPELAAAAREDVVQVRRALQELPEHEQVVVVLFYFVQQSHAEIGERLQLPVSTVKKRLHDARRRLRMPLEASEASADLALAPVPPIRGRDALTLAAMDTPQAREVLHRHAPEELAGALQELPADQQVAFLEMAERLPEIVPCLPETALTHTIRSVGLADAGWLVEFASPEQRVAALDLDCWKNGRLSPARLFEWIDTLVEAGTETLLASFDDIDAEIWILALHSMAQFSIPSAAGDEADGAPRFEEEFSLPDGQTEDGVVFYELRDPDHEARIRAILGTAHAYAPSLYWDFVYGVITESARSCEEVARRWHAGRLNDLGFPDPERAMGVYRPLAPGELPIVESLAVPRADEAPVPYGLEGSAIGRALAALDPERAAEIQGLLFALANAIAVADRLPLSQASALEYSLRKAVEGVDRGLVALAAERHRSLEEIADTTLPRDLFRIGVTLHPELRSNELTLGELEELESDADEVDWGVATEWLSEEDQSLDSAGRPK